MYREHVSVLASVLRRPIVVYAPAGSESRVTERAFESRMSGVYLPLCWEPTECNQSPIAVAYTAGHFSAIIRGAAGRERRVYAAPTLSHPPRTATTHTPPPHIHTPRALTRVAVCWPGTRAPVSRRSQGIPSGAIGTSRWRVW